MKYPCINFFKSYFLGYFPSDDELSPVISFYTFLAIAASIPREIYQEPKNNLINHFYVILHLTVRKCWKINIALYCCCNIFTAYDCFVGPGVRHTWWRTKRSWPLFSPTFFVLFSFFFSSSTPSAFHPLRGIFIFFYEKRLFSHFFSARPAFGHGAWNNP